MLNSILNGDWSNSVPGKQFLKGHHAGSSSEMLPYKIVKNNKSVIGLASVQYYLHTILVWPVYQSAEYDKSVANISLFIHNRRQNYSKIVATRPDLVATRQDLVASRQSTVSRRRAVTRPSLKAAVWRWPVNVKSSLLFEDLL